MTDLSGHYIHGSEPEEQRRLALLNDLLNESSLQALALQGGERILDVGSGLGQLTRAMARIAGSGRVVGIERDPEQLEKARELARDAGEEDLVEFRLGEAVNMPLDDDEWGTFDVAHTRFLLEHVPRPQAVVDGMVRAVHPGGRVILEDDDHDLLRLWPEVKGFVELWRAYLRTYDRLGNDPYVGRRLVSMLRTAGAEPSKNDMLFFGSCAGDSSFEAFVNNFVGLLEGAPETILSSTSLSRTELEEGIAELKRWGERPDGALWYVTCWAEGRRPRKTSDSDDVPAKHGKLKPVRPRAKLTSMEFLIESAVDLNSSLRLDEVFKKIGDRVRELIDCHLFCVMLWNEETQLLEHSYSLKFGEHIEQEGGFPLGYGLSGSAAADRRPIRVPDVSKDPRYIRFRHAEVDVGSELAVPLVVKDRLIGALDLESQQLDAFSEEHEKIVTALAAQIATALENAQLYEKLRSRERRLEADLETARQIQTALLPVSPPPVAGIEIGAAFAAASELSGDFYDFLRYPDGRVALVLGDVAGKSTAAALYGSLAVGMMRGFALEHASEPAELLEHLNGQLHALRIEHRFVAMSFALFDPQSSVLAIGNAGVPQPLLVRDRSATRVDVTGVPLGGLREARYDVAELEVRPGDLLVFLSDGLEDCQDDRGERLGDRRLAEFLVESEAGSAQQVADDLLVLSAEYCSAAQVLDDRTVVVLKATRP